MNTPTISLSSLALLLAVLAAVPASAQVARPGGPPTGAYGGASARVAWFDGEPTLMAGFEGALRPGGPVEVGLAGYGLTSVADVTDAPGGAGRKLEGGYGGLTLGLVGRTPQGVEAVARVLLGAGGLHAVRRLDGASEGTGTTAFFVAEPTVGLAVSPAGSVQVGVEGGYRFVRWSDLDGFTDDDLGGPVAAVTVRFGSF